MSRAHPGETPAKTRCKQAGIFSGEPPNMETASCVSVAATITSLSVVATYWHTWTKKAALVGSEGVGTLC